MDWGLYDQEGTMRQRYLAIDERVLEVKDYLDHLRHHVQEFHEMYDISWLYHENGLEGVVLTYPEIKSAIDNKIISDVSLMPTYRDIKNQKRCIDLVRQKIAQKEQLDINCIETLHSYLVHNANDAKVYRRDIPIHRTYFHEITAPQKINDSLQSCIDYLNAQHEAELHAIELAANVHHRFMHTFPFSQHSGFIGRLLLTYVLLRADAYPVIIHTSDRQRYYEALRGSESEFRSFVAEALENSLDNMLRYFTHNRSRQRSLVS